MPDTNDFHGESKVIYEDEDWLIVEPMDYDSFMYYTPDNNRLMWKDVRNGQLFCIVSKEEYYNNGLQTYMIFKDDNNKISYHHWNGTKRPKNDFVEYFPDEIKSQVFDLIGVGKMYDLLTRIVNGEQVSSRWMENVDESVYDFKFTPKAPIKSKIDLRFDEDDYIKLFNPSDDDMWYYNAITGNYDTYEWEDDYQATEDFKEGYFFHQFNEENLKKVKQILSIISSYLNLQMNI